MARSGHDTSVERMLHGDSHCPHGGPWRVAWRDETTDFIARTQHRGVQLTAADYLHIYWNLLGFPGRERPINPARNALSC